MFRLLIDISQKLGYRRMTCMLGLWRAPRLYSRHLNAWTMDAWTIGVWKLEPWMPTRLDSGCLNSQCLNSAQLDAWTKDTCTIGRTDSRN